MTSYEELKAFQKETAKRMSRLTWRERHVIRLRFGFDTGFPVTLEVIGRGLNVTRERVRQIESKALRKLYAKEQQ